ncbi:hypothetical protein FA13DRAFT_1306375 [Coprinellus micaceus]|uniref:C2H2-type domain-containing protein n=1 Tax=Coprinellus micaceus TaxID=71717 RepID=A0A4Y7STI8_COPMI|nr:hypothetical protein FA13DRAFT_1306375 [Coprinellus micaceus]
MENSERLFTSDVEVPTRFPLATGDRQRFPESCQRSSLADPAASDDIVEDNDRDLPVGRSNGATQGEASPSYRFYHAHRSRRISESSTDSGYSSHSPDSQSHSPFLPYSYPFHPSASSPYPLRPSWHSATSMFESYEPPALSDCDSMSSVSSEGPQSPDGHWSGPGTSAEPTGIFERLPPPVQTSSPLERLPSPTHSRPSSSESGTTDLQASIVDIDKHSTFSKVVVTKFSNPPRYRLKKVKFHQCPICQKSFPRPSGLRTHMNMHTNTKPYTCPYESCDKSFSVISNAKRHYRTHLVELPLEEMGLPSGPYTVNFSDPFVIPDSPSRSELYFTSSPSTSPSNSASSLATSSPSSFDEKRSASSPSLSEQRRLRYPTTRSRSTSRDMGVPARRVALPAVEEAIGGAELSGGTGRRQNLKARTLRWLPMGSDCRSPWKSNTYSSSQR